MCNTKVWGQKLEGYVITMAKSSLLKLVHPTPPFSDGKGQPEDTEGSTAVSSFCREEEEQPSSSPVSLDPEVEEAETSAASGGAQNRSEPHT